MCQELVCQLKKVANKHIIFMFISVKDVKFHIEEVFVHQFMLIKKNVALKVNTV